MTIMGISANALTRMDSAFNDTFPYTLRRSGSLNLHPESRLPGTIDACVIEWAMTMTRLLGLAREDDVRRQLIAMHPGACETNDRVGATRETEKNVTANFRSE